MFPKLINPYIEIDRFGNQNEIESKMIALCSSFLEKNTQAFPYSPVRIPE